MSKAALAVVVVLRILSFHSVAGAETGFAVKPSAVKAGDGAKISFTLAAAELGLEPGKDVDIVGWTAEEQYETGYRMRFKGAKLPPTMVWSVAELARRSVARLAERRASPSMSPTLIKVPTRLRLPEAPKEE